MGYIIIWDEPFQRDFYYCETINEVKEKIEYLVESEEELKKIRLFQVEREIPVPELIKTDEKDFEECFQRMLIEDQELIKELPYDMKQLRDIYKREYEHRKEMAEKNPLHKLVLEIVENNINSIEEFYQNKQRAGRNTKVTVSNDISHTGLSEEEYRILEDHLDPELNRDSIEELTDKQVEKRNKEIDESIQRLDDLSEKLKHALQDEDNFNKGLNFVFENYSETLKGLLEKKRMERAKKREESKRKTEEFLKGLWTKHHENGSLEMLKKGIGILDGLMEEENDENIKSSIRDTREILRLKLEKRHDVSSDEDL